MKTLHKLISSALLLALHSTMNSQDIHFSQFHMSPLTLNPALSGAQHDVNVAINYKTQWSSVAIPFNTMAFSYDMRFGKKDSKGFLAMGLNFFSDKSGDAKLATSQGGLSIAYHVHMNGYNTFGGGIQTGYGQRSIQYGALMWGNQYDGNAYNAGYMSGEPNTGAASINYLDMSGGLDWNFDDKSGAKSVTNNHDHKFNIGIAAYHLNQPKYSFYGTKEKLYIKYIVHGTGTFSLASSNVALVPGFLYERQGPTQEIFAGTMFRFLIGQDAKYTGFKHGAAISFGGYVRVGDAIAPALLLEYANYAFGLSYDVNTSELKSASNTRGGFELSLRFVTPNPFEPKSSASFFN